MITRDDLILQECEDGRTLGITKFDSYAEFVEFCNSLPKELRNEDNDDNWIFGTQFPNKTLTEQTLINGCTSQSMLDKAERLSISLKERVQPSGDVAISVKRQRKFVCDDGEVNIDRYLGGNTEIYETTFRQGKQKSIRLAINIGLSSGNNETQFQELCASLIAVSEILDRMGFATHVLAIDSVHSPHLKTVYHEGGSEVTLKAPNEQFDIERLCTAGLPGALRWFGFRYTEWVGKPTSGYGFCKTTTEEFKKFLNLDLLIERKWSSFEQQVDYISKELTRIIEESRN